MDITVDTSVLLAVGTNEVSKPRLIELTTGCTLIAPVSIHWEIGNALSAMLKRSRLDLVMAQSCVVAYQQIPVKLLDVDLAQALTLAHRFRMYAYDAYILVCAMQSGSPLLTLDGALRIAAGQLGVAVMEV